MLASSPSIYTSVLEGFENGGNASTYASQTAPGFGVAWNNDKFEVSSNYIANAGQNATSGLLSDTASKWLTKVGYGSDRWQLSIAMAKNSCDDPTPGVANDTEAAGCPNYGQAFKTTGATLGRSADQITGNQTAYALRGYWKPESTGAIPAVQIGYEWSNIDDSATEDDLEATRSWMAGLIWDDAFVDGNKAGIAIGVPEHGTEYVQAACAAQATCGPDHDPANKAFQWEAYYEYNVNDGISITPSIFGFKDRYNGQTLANDGFGGLIQTKFKF
jgi:hypothetical protein